MLPVNAKGKGNGPLSWPVSGEYKFYNNPVPDIAAFTVATYEAERRHIGLQDLNLYI
jgi:hypothetical protein